MEAAAAVLKAGAALPGYKVLAVNAFYFNNAGAYISQELGYALAWGNELLAKLTEAGLDATEVTKKIKFNFGISSNYFMEIAKFRAARWLCSQTEAMSAALAGVDSITVRPFDKTYQTPDDFSERIARNQQLLLKEECHLDKVVDPSAGSYYVEVLTNSLADVAWKLFLEVEDKGGFGAEVASGEIQKAVNASNEARKKAVATRREILLGTNQFPNFNEVAAEKIQNEAAVVVVTIAVKRLSRLSISHGVLRNLKLCVWQRKRAARLRKYSC